MLSEEEMDLINTLETNLAQIPYQKTLRQFNILLGSIDAGKTSLLNASKLNHIQTFTNDEMELNIWFDNDSYKGLGADLSDTSLAETS